MAAPFFFDPDSLRADLLTLGYPDVNEKSVHTTGEARLATLTWLASQADPSFTPSTPEVLAAFWDRLGIHSAPPNKAGYRIPFTAPSDRPRDKNAANHFLRAAIDLVFAFRARRQEDPFSNSWQNDDDQILDHDQPLSQFDSDCMEQIGILISQRHSLFPNTARLFQSNPARKRPLQRRPINMNKTANPVPRTKKAEKVEKSTVPSREHILERLRKVQRRANDLEAQLQSSCKASKRLATPSEGDDVSAYDSASVQKLAEDARALSEVFEQFDTISREGLGQRERISDLAVRDQQMEATLGGLAKESASLLSRTTETIDRARQARSAIEELARRKLLLEGLPDSAPICEVLRQQNRTLLHM